MNQYIEPSHIQIETINGVCSARCTMCTINQWTRPKHVMALVDYESILLKLKKISSQKFLTLHGLGEPLLDKELPQKISIAKKLDFKGIGFASNCTHLTEKKAFALCGAGLDTLICSVDGATKETHENIRIGTDFHAVEKNILKFIDIRNTGNYKTRVLVRFINQESNSHEWESYQKRWGARIDPARGDGVLRFDVHNWGETIKIKRERERERERERNAPI